MYPSASHTQLLCALLSLLRIDTGRNIFTLFLSTQKLIFLKFTQTEKLFDIFHKSLIKDARRLLKPFLISRYVMFVR